MITETDDRIHSHQYILRTGTYFHTERVQEITYRQYAHTNTDRQTQSFTAALWVLFIRNADKRRPMHCGYILHIKITSFQKSLQQVWLVMLDSYTKVFFITISSDKEHRLESYINSGHTVFLMLVSRRSNPPYNVLGFSQN